jgi:hypothetical protein
VASLRFHHAGQRNELTSCFRIANGPVPWSLVVTC